MVLRQFRDRFAAPARPIGPPQPAAAAKPDRPAADFQRALGRDQRTGLPNRHCFTYLLAAQAALATQFETQLSVLVLDWAGYEAAGTDLEARERRLAKLATKLRAALLRRHDVLGSLGDGRLAALLPFTGVAGADRVARNLQRAAQDVLYMDPGPPFRPPALGLDDPMKVFGRSAGEIDDYAGDDCAPGEDESDLPFPDDDIASDGDVLNVGVASYCGKGSLVQDALLRAAEQAAIFASVNGGNHISRSEVEARSDF